MLSFAAGSDGDLAVLVSLPKNRQAMYEIGPYPMITEFRSYSLPGTRASRIHSGEAAGSSDTRRWRPQYRPCGFGVGVQSRSGSRLRNGLRSRRRFTVHAFSYRLVILGPIYWSLIETACRRVNPERVFVMNGAFSVPSIVPCGQLPDLRPSRLGPPRARGSAPQEALHRLTGLRRRQTSPPRSKSHPEEPSKMNPDAGRRFP